MSYKLSLNQAVLDNKGRTDEFFEILRHVVCSEISKRYGNSIFHNQDLIEDMQSAAAESTLIAMNNYDSSKGTFLSYAYSFIVGAIHKEYCLQIFGLTVYYAKKLQQISDILCEYYNTNDSQLLYSRLDEHKIRKHTILSLYNNNKLDIKETNICISILKEYHPQNKL